METKRKAHIREIYCRMPGDPGYKHLEKDIEVPNDIQNILQRCRVCLGTRPGQVLGDPYFGIDLEDYLFNMSVDQDEIEKDVRDLICNYAGAGFEDEHHLDAKVYYGHIEGDTSDYLLVDIYIDEIKYLGIIVS